MCFPSLALKVMPVLETWEKSDFETAIWKLSFLFSSRSRVRINCEVALMPVQETSKWVGGSVTQKMLQMQTCKR